MDTIIAAIITSTMAMLADLDAFARAHPGEFAIIVLLWIISSKLSTIAATLERKGR